MGGDKNYGNIYVDVCTRSFSTEFFFSYKRNHWEKELKVDFWRDYRKMKNIYIKAIEHATQWVNLEWTSRGCINRGTNVFFSKESCHTIQISSSEFNYFIYQPMLRMEFYQKRKIGLSFNGPQYRWAGIVLDLTKIFSATFSFKGKSNCVSVKWRNMIQISQKNIFTLDDINGNKKLFLQLECYFLWLLF